MKKILAFILTLSFVLCSVAALSVSAANTDWTVKKGGAFITYPTGNEFSWKADSNGQTWEWPVIRNGSMQEGSITATVSPKGGVGIFFGGSGVSNVTDSTANVKNSENVKFAIVVFEYDSTTPKLKFFYDDKAEGGATISAESNMPLTDSKYGIDGTSDVTIKVEFTAAGKVVSYVNGEKVMTRESGFPVFGTEYGMMTRNASYGTEKAGAEVGYVKSFSKSAPSNYNKWTPRRGGSAFAEADGGEFAWKYVADGENGRTYNNLIQYYKDLEEGTVIAKVAKNSRVGIAFAGTGFENVKEGSGNVAVSTAPDLKYYWAVVDWDGSAGKYYLALMTDASDADGTRTTVKKEYLTTDISTADYTIKVDFTKNGDIKVYFNNDKLIDVSGQTIYGDQLGMLITPRGPLAGKAGQTAGSVKSFEISAPAAETGDSASLYFVLSALALCMILTVAYAFRKKRITE